MKLLHAFVQLLLRSPKFPGRDYLIEKMPLWFLKKAKGPTVVQTRFGFKILVDPIFDKNIENVIYERGVYEQGTISILQSRLKTGHTFIDVGANIGFLSLTAASIVGNEGSVIAFEPHPKTFSLLSENAHLNGFSQIKLNQKGVGAINETVTIYSEDKNRGGASITNKRSDKGTTIQVERLDDLYSGEVDMIKIDVEGYEMNVLLGAEQLIRNSHPILIVEFSTDRNNVTSGLEMYEWIQKLGIYSFYKLEHGKERKSKLISISKTEDLPRHDNLICIPING
jgi:FkbM family methyltransferase